MTPRTRLVAQMVLRRADHPRADQLIVRVGPVRSQSIEPLRQCHSDAMPTAGGVEDPQARERAQLVLGIVKALRKLEGPCPGRGDLRTGNASGIYQRYAQCGVELHFAVRVRAWATAQGSCRRSLRHASARRSIPPEGAVRERGEAARSSQTNKRDRGNQLARRLHHAVSEYFVRGGLR